VRVFAQNRKARHEYSVEETVEAGIVLTGTEVKSIRAGRVNLSDSYALIRDGEVFLLNMHVAPYSHGGHWNHEPTRTRKLLLHRRQIAYLAGKVRQRGYTLIPLRVYLKGDWIKVELGLARGKKLVDRRRELAEREAQRRIQQALRRRA
jgi:SsrA-binding protein